MKRNEIQDKMNACIAVMTLNKRHRIAAFLEAWKWEGTPDAGTVDNFCDAAEKWMRASKTWDHREALRLDIGKSNLLYRVLYLGEPIREMECPLHKGECSGIHIPYDMALKLGAPHCSWCEMTGWVRTEKASQLKELLETKTMAEIGGFLPMPPEENYDDDDRNNGLE